LNSCINVHLCLSLIINQLTDFLQVLRHLVYSSNESGMPIPICCIPLISSLNYLGIARYSFTTFIQNSLFKNVLNPKYLANTG
jgi:hypothetical protein